MLKLENRTEEFNKINITGTIPAIEDGEISLGESHTIIKYLWHSRNQYRSVNHLYSDCPKTRAKIDHYLDWHLGVLRQKATPLVRNIAIFPKFGIEPLEKLELLQRDLMLALQIIDKKWLGNNNKYINGLTSYSIADISCFFELQSLQTIDYSLQSYPNILSW